MVDENGVNKTGTRGRYIPIQNMVSEGPLRG